jgi:hypothetical protein
VFATWHIHPTRNLPETSAEAFTHLIDYYFAAPEHDSRSDRHALAHQ